MLENVLFLLAEVKCKCTADRMVHADIVFIVP